MTDSPKDAPTVRSAPSEGQKALAELLGSRYEILSKLGSGAFGDVYRARDSVLNREVAIKRIRLDVFAEGNQLEEVKQRFMREAQVAARLRHPNIVTTHDIVATPSMSFMVLELIDGQTLQSLLASRGRLSLSETVVILTQVAAALDYAHEHQVVHRDVKPANIMIEPSGRVKVMDFGIAKAEHSGNLTATGHIVGTPNYMSPEQARGLKVDGRSDLFSLGCIVYECLTGDRPFRGDNLTSILIRILTEEPASVDFEKLSLPGSLQEILKRAMAKDPALRYALGADLIGALENIQKEAPVTAMAGGRPALPPPVPLTERRAAVNAIPPPKKSFPWKPVAVLGALAVAVGVYWGTARGTGPTPVVPKGSKHVSVEDVGFVGKVLGRAPRLLITVPADTRLSLKIETPLSSETAKQGERVRAEVALPVKVDGFVAIPAGARVAGHVSHAAPAGRVQGRGELTLEFDSVTLPEGDEITIQAQPYSLKARSTAKRDAGIIGGAAGIGAVVGGIIGGKKGAAVGGAAGAGAGTGTVLATKGEEAVLGAGASVAIELSSPARVRRPAAAPADR